MFTHHVFDRNGRGKSLRMRIKQSFRKKSTREKSGHKKTGPTGPDPEDEAPASIEAEAEAAASAVASAVLKRKPTVKFDKRLQHLLVADTDTDTETES